jgi:hypothetical protein
MLPATHLVGVIGTLIAERLLYVPLLGWAWMIGEGARRVSKNSTKKKIVLLVLLIACCGALGAKTVSRNRDWESNDVLFERTIEVVPNSLKGYFFPLCVFLLLNYSFSSFSNYEYCWSKFFQKRLANVRVVHRQSSKSGSFVLSRFADQRKSSARGGAERNGRFACSRSVLRLHESEKTFFAGCILLLLFAKDV